MQISDYLINLNVVDYAIIFCLLLFLILGVRRGFVGGLFALIGTLIAAVLSLHYYPIAGEFISDKTRLPLDFTQFVCLVVIAAGIILAFALLKKVISLLIKIETVKILDGLGGLIFGACQSILLTSLIIVILLFTTVSKIEKAVLDSQLGVLFVKPAAGVYIYSWNVALSKLVPQEEFNDQVEDLLNL